MQNTLVKEDQYVKLIILRLWEQTPVPLFVFEELMSVVAVRERFELPDPFGSSVFKTDGLSHSPTLPCCPPERAVVFYVLDSAPHGVGCGQSG